jgi:Flp pilus assembly pilin Flp
MNPIVALQTKLYLLKERFRRSLSAKPLAGGQTMTEYALILSAVAIATYITYQSLGTQIKAVISGIVNDLTNAASGE